MRILYSFIGILFFALNVSAFGDAALQEEVQEILHEINGFKFQEADEKLKQFGAVHQDTFYAPFLHAYRHYWRFLLAPYDNSVGSELREAAEKTIALCEKEAFTDNNEAKLIKGCSYVFLSALMFEDDRPLLSLRWLSKGIQVVKPLEGIHELTGDVSFILGSYQLYRVIKDTDSALKKLEISIQEGGYFSTLARLLKARIYQRGEGEPEKSLPIYRELNREYPANPLVSFYLAKNLQMIGEYRESLETFERTLEHIDFLPLPLEMMCLLHFSAGQIYENTVRNYREAAREYLAAYETADRSVEQTLWFIPWSSLHLGTVYAKMNDHDTALLWLNKVEKKDDRRAWEKAAKLINRLTPPER